MDSNKTRNGFLKSDSSPSRELLAKQCWQFSWKKLKNFFHFWLCQWPKTEFIPRDSVARSNYSEIGATTTAHCSMFIKYVAYNRLKMPLNIYINRVAIYYLRLDTLIVSASCLHLVTLLDKAFYYIIQLKHFHLGFDCSWTTANSMQVSIIQCNRK